MTNIKGKVRVHTGRMIHYMGGIYDGMALELVSQLVENSVDSGATDIWCILEADRIFVIDNGSGMIDDILPVDRQTILEFPEKIRSGQLPKEADLRRYVSEASRHSLVWMMEHVGYSAKVEGKKGERGVRGIGFQGVYSLGSDILVLTRPKFEYAQERWPEVTMEKIAVWQLKPPSASELGQFTDELGYDIDVYNGKLQSPFHKTLTSGTRVEITGLKEGVLDQLTPGVLVTYLSGRFGEDIRKRGVKIMVIDRFTAQGRKNGGRELHVQPPEYKGIPILQRILHLGADGTLPFEVNLFYSPKVKNRLMLRRMGSEVSALTDMQEFNRAPWNGLSGTVDFPVLENEDSWDTSKLHLLPSKSRDKWASKLRALETAIEAEIRQNRDRVRQKELEVYAKNAAAALNSAIAEIPTFENITSMVQSKRTRKTVQQPEVTVLVRNQFGRQTKLEGLTVQLFKSGSLQRVFNLVGGKFSFGTLDKGSYSVVLGLPMGMTIKGDVRRSFTINPSNPGHVIIYQIVTDEKEPEKRVPVPKIIPILDSFGAPEPFYENWLHVGQVRINIDTEVFQSIVGDKQKMDIWFADLMASALTEYRLSGPPAFLFQERTKLYYAILQHLNRL